MLLLHYVSAYYKHGRALERMRLNLSDAWNPNDAITFAPERAFILLDLNVCLQMIEGGHSIFNC